jgi:hypothetical protein
VSPDPLLDYCDSDSILRLVKILSGWSGDERSRVLSSLPGDPGLSDLEYDVKIATADFVDLLSLLEIALACGAVDDELPGELRDVACWFVDDCLEAHVDFRGSSKLNARLLRDRIGRGDAARAALGSARGSKVFLDFFTWTIDIETRPDTNGLYRLLQETRSVDDRWQAFLRFLKGEEEGEPLFPVAASGLLTIADLIPVFAEVLRSASAFVLLRDQMWAYHAKWFHVDLESEVRHGARVQQLLYRLITAVEEEPPKPRSGGGAAKSTPVDLRRRMEDAMPLFDKSPEMSVEDAVDAIRNARNE